MLKAPDGPWGMRGWCVSKKALSIPLRGFLLLFFSGLSSNQWPTISHNTQPPHHSLRSEKTFGKSLFTATEKEILLTILADCGYVSLRNWNLGCDIGIFTWFWPARQRVGCMEDWGMRCGERFVRTRLRIRVWGLRRGFVSPTHGSAPKPRTIRPEVLGPSGTRSDLLQHQGRKVLDVARWSITGAAEFGRIFYRSIVIRFYGDL